MKEGLISENGELVYYKEGQPYHAGAIKVDGAIYYIDAQGHAVKGYHIVHREKSNGLLKRGTYKFGEDCKLVKGFYKAPKKQNRKSHKHKSILSRIRTKTWRKLFIATAAAAVLFIAGWCIWTELSPESQHPGTEPGTTQSAEDVVLPEFNADVLLCSEAAKQEYDGKLSLQDAAQTGNPYRAFRFSYRLTNTSGTLHISEDPAMAVSRTYEMPENKTTVLVDNLKTGTTYYYKVVAGGKEYFGSFRTAPSTRFVSIPSLVNTRDIGGYVNTEGKTVKQGLLIRGPEMDGLVNSQYFVPADALDDVKADFGFVYDMDLRSPSVYSGNYTSRLNVPQKFYNAPSYGEVFNADFRGSLQQIFADLANPQNYPMYMHCTWGVDRTGTVIFLLQGLLGLSDEDMIREYQLTGYTKPDVFTSENLNVLISGLQPYDGDTLSEKVVSYLTTVVGVTDQQIADIRSIYLSK